MNSDILIIGAGGHARSVIDIIQQENKYRVIGCIDNAYDPTTEIECLPGIGVIGNDDMLPDFYSRGIKAAFVALGNNRLRGKIYDNLKKIGYEFVNAISPRSIISPYAKLGKGICVMAGAVINVNTVIGDDTIINTNCSVDHDCIVGVHCHVAPGVAVSGKTMIGDYTQIGTGSSVIDEVRIGKNSFVGAGAAVVCDIPDNVLAYGVPARVIKTI